MKFIDRPAGYPAALHWPPALPILRVYSRALQDAPLTQPERQKITTAVRALADYDQQIADASPGGLKAQLDKLVARGRSGDESVSVGQVREAAAKLESAKIGEAAVRDLLGPKQSAAQHSVDPVALRLLDQAEATLAVMRKEVGDALARVCDVTGDPDDSAFWDQRFRHTQDAIDAQRDAIQRGGALPFLAMIAVPEATATPKPSQPPDGE